MTALRIHGFPDGTSEPVKKRSHNECRHGTQECMGRVAPHCSVRNVRQKTSGKKRGSVLYFEKKKAAGWGSRACLGTLI
jgi:hypothetical protein